MALDLNKAGWWDEFASYFQFSNDASAIISSTTLLQNLQTYVAPYVAQTLSPTFITIQPAYITATPSADISKPNILISTVPGQSELISGGGSWDYMSGKDGDDIMHGGNGYDIFNPGAGRDILFGNSTLTNTELDTVTYRTATSGIFVGLPQGTVTPPPPPPTPIVPVNAVGTAGQDRWIFSQADWLDASTPNIKKFQVGPGGDIIDVTKLLAAYGYTGTNPVLDNYIRLKDIDSGMKIQFDPDGKGGISPLELAKIYGVKVAQFSIADNFAFNTPDLNPPPPASVPDPVTDFTIVSNDGQGGYDVLYAIDNLMGSDFADTINEPSRGRNIIFAGGGDDIINAGEGDDIISGDNGSDTAHGNVGNDLFLIGSGGDTLYGDEGADIFKFTGTLLTAAIGSTAIQDFATGLGGDKINVAEILFHSGYHGSDAVADGFITITQGATGTEIGFDADGTTGAGVATTIAILNNVTAANFSITNNLVTTAPSIIYSPVLGQSNASGLRVFNGDTESGITRLALGLDTQTPASKIVILPKDELNQIVDYAVGGTTVSGGLTNHKVDEIWWYPVENRPGELLIRAVDLMALDIAQQRAAGVLTPVVIWGQGEAEANLIGGSNTLAIRQAAAERYENSLRSVFDYIKAHLGNDIEFYMMQTGRYSIDAAHAAGVSDGEITRTTRGLDLVHSSQIDLALRYDDIHIATNYDDLPLMAEVTAAQDPAWNSSWTTDVWHLHYESREIVGDRLADFIALDLGYDHVLNRSSGYSLLLLADIDVKGDAGLIIDGNINDNIITGTLGNDTIHGGDGVDAILGGAGQDVLYGDAGNDIFYFDKTVLHDVQAAQIDPLLDIRDIISDFTVGVGGDLVDIGALLHAAGYIGTDALADGYATVTGDATQTLVSIDVDGTAGAATATVVAQLTGIDVATFDLIANLKTTTVTGIV